MKPNIPITILYISFLFLFSCVSRSKNENAKEHETIKVFENIVTELQTSKLLDGIEYIPLETKEECLIGKIEKIQCINDAISKIYGKIQITKKQSYKITFYFFSILNVVEPDSVITCIK